MSKMDQKLVVRNTLLKEVAGYSVDTKVVIVESLGDGEAWFVEVSIKDNTLIGGFRYDVIEVLDSEIE